jgi:hypothetical protein
VAVLEFPHETGAHCGSTALRDLSAYDGWGLDESACFGVGGGLGFTFVRDAESASRAFVGRTPWLESAALDHLGVGFTERSGQSWSAAWAGVREQLDAGRPVVVFVDRCHLDYYDTSTHFGPHTVVAVGADEGTVALADSEFEGVQRLPLERFREAWSSEHGFRGPLRNRWLAVTEPEPTRSLADAFRAGLRRAAAGMLDPGDAGAGRTGGVPGVRAFAEDLRSWADLPDASWCARFAYQNVEKRGTGGGAFRGLYAPFVAEAVECLDLDPALAARARDLAEDWSALGETLRGASEADDPASAFERASEQAGALAEAEASFHRESRGSL